MKNFFLSLFILFFNVTLFAQHVIDTTTYKRNGIAISPSKVTHINGVMFNFWEKFEHENRRKYPTINGLELNFEPFGIIVFPMFLAHGLLDKDSRTPFIEPLDSINFKKNKTINGVHIGLGNNAPTNMNGVAIDVLGIFRSKINGLLISPLMNRNYIVNGITIGLLGNHDIKCNGIQIGLFNSCTELRGVQIGLFNKTPTNETLFINWNFKKNKGKKP
jgi:hypothetical protein